MAGFLDSQAPSTLKEYARFIDGDMLGKMLLKNFLVNIVGLPNEQIQIPLGRFGFVENDVNVIADAKVFDRGKWVDVEIKCARCNIANRTRGDKKENWAFHGLLTSRKRVPRKYDIAFVIGVWALGLEGSNYWNHLQAVAASYEQAGVTFDVGAMPHEEGFLPICSFFVLPHAAIGSNYWRLTLDAMAGNQYLAYQSWGYDKDRCRRVWQNALEN